MLGIIVNTERHAGHLAGITRAARARGHDVHIFLTEAGTKLLDDPAVRQLALLQGVEMTFCHHSASAHGVAVGEIGTEITAGSQLNNAIMNHRADRVIVL